MTKEKIIEILRKQSISVHFPYQDYESYLAVPDDNFEKVAEEIMSTIPSSEEIENAANQYAYLDKFSALERFVDL